MSTITRYRLYALDTTHTWNDGAGAHDWDIVKETPLAEKPWTVSYDPVRMVYLPGVNDILEMLAHWNLPMRLHGYHVSCDSADVVWLDSAVDGPPLYAIRLVGTEEVPE
jgi:hypothetical protein